MAKKGDVLSLSKLKIKHIDWIISGAVDGEQIKVVVDLLGYNVRFCIYVAKCRNKSKSFINELEKITISLNISLSMPNDDLFRWICMDGKKEEILNQYEGENYRNRCCLLSNLLTWGRVDILEKIVLRYGPINNNALISCANPSIELYNFILKCPESNSLMRGFIDSVIRYNRIDILDNIYDEYNHYVWFNVINYIIVSPEMHEKIMKKVLLR